MTSGLGFCLVLYGIGFSSVRVLARFLLSDLGSVYFGSWQNLCSSLVHSCWIRVLSPSLSSSYCETITMTITTTTFRFWLTGQFTRDHSRRGRVGFFHLWRSLVWDCLHAGCPSCDPSNSVKALKEIRTVKLGQVILITCYNHWRIGEIMGRRKMHKWK